MTAILMKQLCHLSIGVTIPLTMRFSLTQDLQSIGSSPDFKDDQFMLVKYNDPKWESGTWDILLTP